MVVVENSHFHFLPLSFSAHDSGQVIILEGPLSSFCTVKMMTICVCELIIQWEMGGICCFLHLLFFLALARITRISSKDTRARAALLA